MGLGAMRREGDGEYYRFNLQGLLRRRILISDVGKSCVEEWVLEDFGTVSPMSEVSVCAMTRRHVVYHKLESWD